VKRFPNAPLAITAQQRIDLLKQAIREREDKARAEREAARIAAEEARRRAEQEKAELAAQKKRDDDERRAREAEAAEKARAAAAAVAAERKRQEDERRAAAAEAERQAKAAEAERKAQEARQKAEQAQRERIAAEARIAAEKQAKAAEAERKAQDARLKTEQAERDRAAAEAAAAKLAADKQAREAEDARKKAEMAAAREAICKDEQGRFDAIVDKGSEATGVEDLKAFSRTVTCDRLAPVVVAAIDRFTAEIAKRAATQPNSPQLVTSAQTELVRLGCLTGKPDGQLTDPTRAALSRYFAIGGQPTDADKVAVTQELVGELIKHTTRVCPLQCKSDETAKGDVCIANERDKPAATVSRKSDEEDKPRRKPSRRDADRDPARRNETPRARQQAVARPSIVSGGSGGHSAMIGVGF
jgi:hypothetical protein